MLQCLEELAHTVNEPCTVEVQRYLSAIAVFHRYSLNNMLMILAQAPDASLVAGFQSWRKLGRFVKSGESGIAIFAPIVRGRKPRRDEDEVENDQAKKAVGRWLSGFKVVHVFDVSQTAGAPLITDVATQHMQFNALGLMRDVYGSLGILHQGTGEKERTPTLLAETEDEAVAFVVYQLVNPLSVDRHDLVARKKTIEHLLRHFRVR